MYDFHTLPAAWLLYLVSELVRIPLVPGRGVRVWLAVGLVPCGVLSVGLGLWYGVPGLLRPKNPWYRRPLLVLGSRVLAAVRILLVVLTLSGVQFRNPGYLVVLSLYTCVLMVQIAMHIGMSHSFRRLPHLACYGTFAFAVDVALRSVVNSNNLGAPSLLQRNPVSGVWNILISILYVIGIPNTLNWEKFRKSDQAREEGEANKTLRARIFAELFGVAGIAPTKKELAPFHYATGTERKPPSPLLFVGMGAFFLFNLRILSDISEFSLSEFAKDAGTSNTRSILFLSFQLGYLIALWINAPMRYVIVHPWFDTNTISKALLSLAFITPAVAILVFEAISDTRSLAKMIFLQLLSLISLNFLMSGYRSTPGPKEDELETAVNLEKTEPEYDPGYFLLLLLGVSLILQALYLLPSYVSGGVYFALSFICFTFFKYKEENAIHGSQRGTLRHPLNLSVILTVVILTTYFIPI